MRIKGEYVLREIAGDYILIPVGETALNMNGLITMDDVGVTIWKGLQNGKKDDEIVRTILNDYEVDEETARSDMEEFLKKLKDADLVEE